MSTIDDYEQRLVDARAAEKETYVAAAQALQNAVRAKKLALHAWIDLAQARGSTDDFKQTYKETAVLQFREDQGCGEFVEMALRTGVPGLLSRFRL